MYVTNVSKLLRIMGYIKEVLKTIILAESMKQLLIPYSNCTVIISLYFYFLKKNLVCLSLTWGKTQSLSSRTSWAHVHVLT